MLQIQAKELDICRISKLLAKYNIKASIFNQRITLEGEVSDKLLKELCEAVTICKVQNFSGEIPYVSTSDKSIQKNEQEVALAPQVIEEYDAIYSTVKRGEVYLCDFGEPYGSEQGRLRYAIVVQNDEGNIYSPTTIVLPCTTERKKKMPVHYHFFFSKENVIDYNEFRVGLKENIVLAEQVRTVDKTRLRKYLGTMTPGFMNKMQEIIDVSLNLTRREKIITKKEPVYVEKIVYREESAKESLESRDLNMVQIQLLSLVDIEELLKISQMKVADEIRIEKILQLFGFDMLKNGVQYLFKAILISPKGTYFNLENLCESISENEPDMEKDEIKRLIVARVKEQFKFKKSPSIDFIRLVNSFLSKKEEA